MIYKRYCIYLADLNPEQREKSYFIEADARHIPVVDAAFDLVFSSYSVFDYEYSEKIPPEVVRDSLMELKRVLAPRSPAYIAQPWFEDAYPMGSELRSRPGVLPATPGLILRSVPRAHLPQYPYRYLERE